MGYIFSCFVHVRAGVVIEVPVKNMFVCERGRYLACSDEYGRCISRGLLSERCLL
jgi:hypothetical protein